jgi:hypothetical protein
MVVMMVMVTVMMGAAGAVRRGGYRGKGDRGGHEQRRENFFDHFYSPTKTSSHAGDA